MNTDHTTDQHYLMALDTIRNGGGTYNRSVFRKAVLPFRYVVAVGAPYEKVIPATLGAQALPAIVKGLRELDNARGVWSHDKALGTWVSDGKAYLDIVESFPDLEHALATARVRDQLAIWDSKDNVEIAV